MADTDDPNDEEWRRAATGFELRLHTLLAGVCSLLMQLFPEHRMGIGRAGPNDEEWRRAATGFELRLHTLLAGVCSLLMQLFPEHRMGIGQFWVVGHAVLLIHWVFGLRQRRLYRQAHHR
eukprot:m51a1_g3860 putative C-tail anchored protein (120) ;mRNA; r:409113-410732